MSDRKPSFVHNGIGDINVDSNVINNHYHGDISVISMQQKLDAVQATIPESFTNEQRMYIIETLKEIKESVANPKSKEKFNNVVNKLKPYLSSIVTTAVCASSITDLINFFAK